MKSEAAVERRRNEEQRERRQSNAVARQKLTCDVATLHLTDAHTCTAWISIIEARTRHMRLLREQAASAETVQVPDPVKRHFRHRQTGLEQLQGVEAHLVLKGSAFACFVDLHSSKVAPEEKLRDSEWASRVMLRLARHAAKHASLTVALRPYVTAERIEQECKRQNYVKLPKRTRLKA